ncbi:class I SAM-dependent methyltransferase [Amycolatopsis sp. H20-H5]|uniref:class I SAM-dependent methyltransferase n=1 Tax=Amycolatopsis sp. H20-H5 TaxID=3046309 RepID=UPI002DB805BA|nr:methyltransferase [Amycolatopsis sp. H20-H5]MEC3976844.1 methyltransferase [Amycolatopsis sp. H20-H5]
MSGTDPDEDARIRAGAALAAGDPTAWFEPLYAAAETGDAVVPWHRGKPNAEIVSWANGVRGTGERAIVVGCALGDDAEYVASLGYETVAFDVAESAIKAVRLRFPASPVDYVVADLFARPPSWRHGFDLVLEISTVQALPTDVRTAATSRVAELLAPGGTLLVGAFAADTDEPYPGPPWPLTRAHVEGFAVDGVKLKSLERTRGGGRWWGILTR